MQPFDALNISLSGPHLVEASAGTGKTYAITTLYLRLLLERNLKVDQILVVTFTEAATAELKDRIRNRLRQALETLDQLEEGETPADSLLAQLLSKVDGRRARLRLQMGLHGFDEAAIFTIHGFCMRMLRDSAFESGLAFDATLITSQQQMLDEIVNDFWVERRFDRFPFEVSHLDQKLRPTTLRRLARDAAENPGITVLPRKEDHTLDRKAVERHQALFSRLRDMWQEHRTEVLDLLDKAVAEKTLKSYRRDWLDGWLARLNGFLEPIPLRSLHLPDKFEKFCTPSMTPNKNKKAPTHAFFDACEELRQSHENLEQDFQCMVEQVKLDLLETVWSKLPSRKEVNNELYFQDLLHFLHRALHGEGSELLTWIIRRRFPAALIDEFQDTDEIQYSIFAKLFLDPNMKDSRASLFLIGDPKQAIYGFRGADIFTYLRAGRDVADHGYTMNTNWRSDPGLISAVNTLFQGHANPFLFREIGYPVVEARPGASDVFQHPESRAPLYFTHIPTPDELDGKPISKDWTDKAIPRMVAVRISRLLASSTQIAGKPIIPGDIAVLVRTNKQAQAVRDALVRYNIPCVLHGNVSVFQTHDAVELELVLRAVAEPTRSQYVKVALSTHLMGCSANDILDMEADPSLWEARVKQFRRWKELWQDQGFIQMFRTWVVDARVQARLFTTAEGERGMTNLLHLAELLQEAATREHLGPAGLVTWLEKQQDTNLAEEAAYELRLESDAMAVAVVTIHRSKGLEYPVVFCPYLWESVNSPRSGPILYHDPQRGERVLDMREEPGTEARLQVEEEEFAESLRLLYVALTRARHHLEVMWGAFNKCGNSPLGYLLFGTDGDRSSKTLKDLPKDEEAMLATLQRKVQQSRGLWQLEVLDPDAHGTRYRDNETIPQLRLPHFKTHHRPSRRNSSFSQLTAASEHNELLPIRDHDDMVELQPTSMTLLARSEEIIPLKDFPKGARAGIFFHGVLENLDFTLQDEARLEKLVEQELRKEGLDTRWIGTVVPAIGDILQTPLTPDGFPRLCDITNEERLNELEFLFPVAAEKDANDPTLLSPQSLARVFHEYPEGLPANYGDQVARLGFVPFRGYMKGFVDLIFRFQDRWYLVDYKSNYLGNTFADYATHKLPPVMADSHYYLQYHIYTVALYRYLNMVLPDFQYERDFGGALYLFIKGMDPQLGSGYGVFHECPPLERIMALSQLMDNQRNNHDQEVGV